MAEDCQTCPELRSRLGAVAGGLIALATFVDRETTEPTMPWKDLLPQVVLRAENLAEQAQGGY